MHSLTEFCVCFIHRDDKQLKRKADASSKVVKEKQLTTRTKRRKTDGGSYIALPSLAKHRKTERLQWMAMRVAVT